MSDLTPEAIERRLAVVEMNAEATQAYLVKFADEMRTLIGRFERQINVVLVELAKEFTIPVGDA